jgi:hypothetical protein
MWSTDLLLGLVAMALLLIVGHWFPWSRRLHRLVAYTWGVASIGVGVTIWLGRQEQWTLLAELAFFVGSAGAVTAGCWLVDWSANARLRLRSTTDDGD